MNFRDKVDKVIGAMVGGFDSKFYSPSAIAKLLLWDEMNGEDKEQCFMGELWFIYNHTHDVNIKMEVWRIMKKKAQKALKEKD